MLSLTRSASVAVLGCCSFSLVAATPIPNPGLLTGSIVDLPESAPYAYTFGDGTHSVLFSWSVNITDRSGWIYRNVNTEVALAVGISSIDQLADASAYSFTSPSSSYVGPVYDAAFTGGLNSFVILKDTTDDFFGVVRLDDVFPYNPPLDQGIYGTSYSGLNATWWFQSDGTPNFSPVPEPASGALLSLGFAALAWRWRRRASIQFTQNEVASCVRQL